MRFFYVVAILVLGLAVLPSSSSAIAKKTDKEAKKEASVWMKSKTKLSQEILVGLTGGDFEKIQRNAPALNFVHFFEIIFREKNDEYRQQLTLYSSANKQLVRQVDTKNIYGAALAYN